MVRRLCILCFLVVFWPGLALAQTATLMEVYYDTQGRYADPILHQVDSESGRKRRSQVAPASTHSTPMINNTE